MTLTLSDWLLIGTLAMGILSYLGTTIANYLREGKRDKVAGFVEAASRQAAIIGERLRQQPPNTDLNTLKADLLRTAVENLKSPALRGDTIKELGFQDAGIKATVEGELAKTLVETAGPAVVKPIIKVDPMAEMMAQITALTERVAAMSPQTTGVAKTLSMLDKGLPTAKEIAAEVLRQQPVRRPAIAKAKAVPTTPARMDTTDVLARTIWAEARSEGQAGMEAVASVVLTRAAHPRWWGSDVRSVCLFPSQFSCWNPNDPQYKRIREVNDTDALFREATDVAIRALAGEIVDRTDGADHYYNPRHADPSWARGVTPTAEIGSHRFLRLEVPPPAVG